MILLGSLLNSVWAVCGQHVTAGGARCVWTGATRPLALANWWHAWLCMHACHTQQHSTRSSYGLLQRRHCARTWSGWGSRLWRGGVHLCERQWDLPFRRMPVHPGAGCRWRAGGAAHAWLCPCRKHTWCSPGGSGGVVCREAVVIPFIRLPRRRIFVSSFLCF